MEGIQVSRFGVISKSHQPGKWRLIVDLSHRPGNSVNDGIDPVLCSLTYTSVEAAAKMVLELENGALLAKVDLQSAYRMVPVHPEDRPLLGMEWNGQYFMDTALPFGLRSAPKIFNALADGLMWMFKRFGVEFVMHYLDDYLFGGQAGTNQCEKALTIGIGVCDEVGAPVAQQKVEGPTTTIQFLGILLDTVAMELQLPADKLRRLKALIVKFKGKRSCTKRELLSLIGHLQHACQVVRPGRSFLRRMIELTNSIHLYGLRSQELHELE